MKRRDVDNFEQKNWGADWVDWLYTDLLQPVRAIPTTSMLGGREETISSHRRLLVTWNSMGGTLDQGKVAPSIFQRRTQLPCVCKFCSKLPFPHHYYVIIWQPIDWVWSQTSTTACTLPCWLHVCQPRDAGHCFPEWFSAQPPDTFFSCFYGGKCFTFECTSCPNPGKYLGIPLPHACNRIWPMRLSWMQSETKGQNITAKIIIQTTK